MGTLYVDTGGAATNSGSSDNNAADLTGTNATVAAAVITLDGSPTLTGLVTSGANQSTIYLAQATNANMKIFWITAFDNTLKTVTVSVAPTGVTGSNWAIGGRFLWTPASIEAALRAGDTVQFNNNPASSASVLYTHRTAGTSAAGFVKLIGKAGVRPALTNTTTTNVINGNSVAGLWLENLEFIQQGASGNAVAFSGTNCVAYNVKVSAAGGAGFSVTGGFGVIAGCEIAVGGIGIDFGSQAYAAYGNYIHDCGSHGIQISSSSARGPVIGNIIDTCAGRGINVTGAAAAASTGVTVAGNTVYGCGNSGLEITDADTAVHVFGNIFMNNGDAAGEYNVEWAAGAAEYQSWHGFNCFYSAGGGGSANLSGLTANSTEITTDPQFVDAAAGDFRLKVTSPAKGLGFQGAFIGGPTGYADMGAVQRVEPHFNLINGGLVA